MNNWFDVIFALASVIITGFLIPLLLQRLNNGKRERAAQLVNLAVRAVQQTGAELTGPQKKAAVNALLGNLGVNLSDSALDVLIESSVWDMKNEQALGVVVEGVEEKMGTAIE